MGRRAWQPVRSFRWRRMLCLLVLVSDNSPGRDLLGWASQLHTPYHNYRKLSHALALLLLLLQGQGKPTTLPGHKQACRQVWEEAQPGSASSRPATQLAVSCHPLLTPLAFCLLKAAVHFCSNEHAELRWDSCCNTANTWKWEGIHQHMRETVP